MDNKTLYDDHIYIRKISFYMKALIDKNTSLNIYKNTQQQT